MLRPQIRLSIALLIIILLNLMMVTLIIYETTAKHCHHEMRKIERIIGGKRIKVGIYRFMAALIFQMGTFWNIHCGASIISKFWVILAAHCMEDDMADSFISSNSINWKEGLLHTVIYYIHHEKYNRNNSDHDIGLIEVEQPFDAKYEKPIPLANSHYEYKNGVQVRALGWGRKSTNEWEPSVTYLLGTCVRIVDQKLCQKMFEKANELDVTFTITNNMFCAASKNRDACNGDSGGPLFDGKLLIGIISWGRGCASDDYPGVYVRLGIYEKWIKKVAKRNKKNIGAVFKSKP